MPLATLYCIRFRGWEPDGMGRPCWIDLSTNGAHWALDSRSDRGRSAR
jgi:hypothetical protein